MNYWDTDPQVFAPPANKKYHGLLNQGATCYLNSVLQVLFMTEDFREAVESLTCGSDLIDRHLQALFEDLNKRTAYTYNITKKLGIDRVNEQRDAAEYYEKILTQTSHEASKIFHGQLTHVTICSTCHAEKNRDGLFWHLPLELVDSSSEDYSVVDGTEEYFRDLNFSGENQMYCDQCDAKSDATVKCVMKHHPEVLMLLKRSQNAYLLFYRKKKIHSAGSCTQDDQEVSTSGGFPPASVNYDHGQDAEQFRKREEDEKPEEKGFRTMEELVTVNRTGQRMIRDVTREAVAEMKDMGNRERR
ncbi:uncharacterized protein AKAME5_002883000 [Lates japonicus]|uniref:USP domain-containing protein n=1 Tax=Lates japonicus TaxID=270547 RepID=A0AAD3R5V4_LATJO|nr:uncharacterized protein AKAME5_002883000 [Lates japonicus]